jgi:hypothetical protein
VRRRIRALALALAVAVALAGCGGDSSQEADPTTTDERDVRAAGTTSTQAPLALDVVDPNQVLVADGVRWGSATTPLAAAVDAVRADPLVLAAEAAVAWDPGAVEPIADVAAVALDPSGFTDVAMVDDYVTQVGKAMGEAAGEVSRSFRHENVLVVLLGANADRIRDLHAGMQSAIARGLVGSALRSTPMKQIPPGSVFLELPTARFDLFAAPETPPSTGTPTTEALDPPPETPALPGGTGQVADGRWVVVAGEVRAVAWSIAVPLSTFDAAEALEGAIGALIEDRPGGPLTSFIGDRTVWSSDGDEEPSTRVFRHENAAVVIHGDDPAQLDALVGEWIGALRT